MDGSVGAVSGGGVPAFFPGGPAIAYGGPQPAAARADAFPGPGNPNPHSNLCQRYPGDPGRALGDAGCFSYFHLHIYPVANARHADAGHRVE